MKLNHSHIFRENSTRTEQNFVFSQDRFRESLIRWIGTSSSPFCTCQQADFVKLIKNLNPEANSISAQTVKRDIMKLFEDSVKEIKIRLSKVAFTVDAWTSKNVLPFMDIRAHWINDDWTYETVMVDFSFIEGNHSGQNLCKIFVDCLERFEIPLSKVSSVTMDNVSANDTFMDFLSKYATDAGTRLSKPNNRIRCLPHVLNLSVQDILSALKVPLNDEEDRYAYLDNL
ncbi:putative AC9 transposase, partial [Pseudolycoriella hygida]